MAWFETWFDTPYYHILYKDRNFTEAESFITLLTNYLQLPIKSNVIDLACGKGRHSLYLNQMGYNVLGLDLSRESILHNKQFESAHQSPSLQFKVHDMRDEIFPKISAEKVDAVFNLFTSFGYFEKQTDDEKVFHSISSVLKDDGFFVLDFLNENWVKNSLTPEYSTVKSDIEFHIKKNIDHQTVVKDIFFSDKGKDYHYYEKVKLHTIEEIANLGDKFGLVRVKIFGDYQLSDFDIETSPRCITIFKKK